MAKTYYGYQERGAESQINWAEVGKNFSDMLAEEARVREEKKAAIDEATREYQKQLNDIPQGQSASINEWALTYADKAQEQLLMQERLLKSGLLKPKDYTVMRQNLVDGTDDAFSLVQTYQDKYAEKMERLKNQDSQQLEVAIMEQLEGFGNFNQSELVINPETGKVSVAMMDADGKLTTDPTKLRSVSSLKTAINMQFDRYKLEEATTAFVTSSGNWEQATKTLSSAQRKGLLEVMSSPMGKVLTKEQLAELGITDPNVIDFVNYYNEAEQDFIDAQLANAYNTSSILTDFSGQGYKFTYNEAEQGGKTILLTTDPQGRPIPQYTEEQREEAERILRNSIRNKTSKEVKVTPLDTYRPPQYAPQYIYQRGEGKKDDANLMLNVGNLYSGDDAQRMEAANFLKSINPNILSIDRTATEVKITYKDLSFEELPFEGMTQRQWASSNINYFLPESATVLNRDEAAKAAGLTGATTPSIGETNVTTGKIEKESPNETFERVVLSAITPDIFVTDDEAKTVENIQGVLASVGSLSGYKVVQSTGGYDVVEILDEDDNAVLTFSLDEGDNRPEDYVTILKRFIRTRAGVDDKTALASLRRLKGEEPAAESTEEAEVGEKKPTPISPKSEQSETPYTRRSMFNIITATNKL